MMSRLLKILRRCGGQYVFHCWHSGEGTYLQCKRYPVATYQCCCCGKVTTS